MYTVRDEEKEIGQIFFETLQVQDCQPPTCTGEGEATSVLTRLGNGECCDGKPRKSVTSGTRSKAPAPSVTTE